MQPTTAFHLYNERDNMGLRISTKGWLSSSFQKILLRRKAIASSWNSLNKPRF
jgi:hypothetical protein